MSDILADGSVPAAPPPAPRRKGVAWLAWIVILAATSAIVVRVATPADEENSEHGEASPGLELVKVQGRLFVGLGEVVRKQDAEAFENSKLYDSSNTLNQGPPRQRLLYVTIAGELKGPAEARRLLGVLREDMKKEPQAVSPADRRLTDILDRWYSGFDVEVKENVDPVTDEEKAFVRTELGWFGDLAFAAGQDETIRSRVIAPAEEAANVFAQVATIGVALGFAGFICLGLILYLAFRGELTSGVQTGSAHGGVYAETFALWLLALMGMSVLVSHIPGEYLVNQSLVFLGSLAILIWPRMRGIPWHQVREDIGWTLGRHPLAEPLLGPVTYVSALPMLAVGMTITMILVLVRVLVHQQAGEGAAEVFSGSSNPITPHPIVQKLLDADWTGRLQIFVLASVVAPIVEETMFRGVFYRHLREATRGLPAWLSMLFSAVVVSFIFAAIHPTGMIAVPMLMALALGFTIAREWRGTLIPSMIAHGISNGLVMAMVISLFGQ